MFLLEELAQSSDSDDIRFIILILEQLKLKVKILELTLNISQKTVDKMLKEIRKTAWKGKCFNFSAKSFLTCKYSYCENKQFNKGDEVVCFVNCTHFFHKFCFAKTNKSDKSEKTAIELIDEEFEKDEEELRKHDRNTTKSLINIANICKICSKTSLE